MVYCKSRRTLCRTLSPSLRLPLLVVIPLQVEIASIWGAKPTAKRPLAKRLPINGLDLDYIQCERVVQVKN